MFIDSEFLVNVYTKKKNVKTLQYFYAEFSNMSTDVPTPECLQKVFQYIDDHRDKWVSNLKEAVAIKSVSAWYETCKSS